MGHSDLMKDFHPIQAQADGSSWLRIARVFRWTASSPTQTGPVATISRPHIIGHSAFTMRTTPCSPACYSPLLLFRFWRFPRSLRTFRPNLRLHGRNRWSPSTLRKAFRYMSATVNEGGSEWV